MKNNYKGDKVEEMDDMTINPDLLHSFNVMKGTSLVCL